jgi:retron-type reverse transcriptase
LFKFKDTLAKFFATISKNYLLKALSRRSSDCYVLPCHLELDTLSFKRKFQAGDKALALLDVTVLTQIFRIFAEDVVKAN